MEIKHNNKTGELTVKDTLLHIEYGSEQIVYAKQNLESVSFERASLLIPSLSFAGSLLFTVLMVFIDFGSLVTLDSQFINISSILSMIGTLLVVIGLVAIGYTAYLLYKTYTYNKSIIITSVSGDTIELELPENTTEKPDIIELLQ